MNAKPSWKVLLSFAAIFLLGGITGASLMRTAQRGAHSQANLERNWAQREGQTLETRLKLRPDQIAQIQHILVQTADKMRQIKLETARQIGELIKRNSGQVMQLLDDGQKKEFEALIQERQSRLAQSPDTPKTPY